MGTALCKLYGKKEVRIIIQGLDASGKTTALYWLKLGEVVTTIPTIGFNVETLEHNNMSITAWDLGGRDKTRPLFRHYYPNTDALIFMIDSNDRDRISEVKEELKILLEEDDLRFVPFLLVANKQDLASAMSIAEITEKLGLSSLNTRPWMVVPAVATKGEGLHEGLDWLTQQLAAKEAKNSLLQPVSQTATALQGTTTGYLWKTYNYISGWFTK